MPCGGCGGGDIKIAPRRTAPAVPQAGPISVQRQLKPKPLQRVAGPPQAQRRKVRTPVAVNVAQTRAKMLRLCPVCGASLSIEITGKTKRRRYRCTRCQKTYT